MTLLHDGRILTAGGYVVSKHLGPYDSVSWPGLWDPRSGRWQDAGLLPMELAEHAAVELQDGRVLLTGGDRGE